MPLNPEPRCHEQRLDHGLCPVCKAIRETRDAIRAEYHETWESNWQRIGLRRYATGYLDGSTGKPPRENIDGVKVL